MNITIKQLSEKLLNDYLHFFDTIAFVSIVCFIVSQHYRRHGISTRLLQTVINYYQKTGKQYLEAYPFKNTIIDSENYHGPSSLYIKNGFYVDKEYDKYIVMKYNLS